MRVQAAMKKAAHAGGQAARKNVLQRICYKTREGSSSPNHKYYLTIGRHVFERPANWNVRLRA
jgi:hypothetical protein